MADQGALKQIIQKVKDSNNVLVTVNTNPSVDELSAALAVTLCINKLNKHATAVFSGDVPPAIEFLNPEKTFENTVDSLRDFIIALDKEKADHLRYKVVDDMVKIFITPYRTTINEKDLEFSQGDYNVELVLAIGVKSEADLDHALESHGRILHDATVAAISLGEPTNLGGIEWADKSASSYSELLYQVADGIKNDKSLLDEQIATAFLTGIVASTDRFSNDKTSSKVMTIAAQLMSAGANQQLVATKLEEDKAITPSESIANEQKDTTDNDAPQDMPEDTTPSKDDDGAGALSISHVPEGDVDEVAEAVGDKNSSDALNRAEEELEKQTEQVNSTRQEDATRAATEELEKQKAEEPTEAPADPTEAAEQKLAEQLAATAPVAPQPVAIPDDAGLKAHSDDELDEPSMGGTLNATTEQAAEDSRKAVEDDRNRTILSHGGTYSATAPSFQSPLNAATGSIDSEPTVPDVLSQGNDTAPTGHAESIQPPVPAPMMPPAVTEAIQPPAPLAPAPTLAEIDAQNRDAHDDARAAIDAALGAQSEPTPAPEAPAPESGDGLAPLPPLPPMPDFSTLPPLPGGEQTTLVPDTLGESLPPAAPADEPPQPPDPSQFQIPGQ